MAVSLNPPIVVFSWLDGNPVTMISTADGTDESFVKRKVQADKVKVPAPVAVAAYNNGMQAVDRHDQLRSMYSLQSRHRFIRYYVAMYFCMVDMALTNASIHYFLNSPEKKNKKDARREFFKELAVSLLSHDNEWKKFDDEKSKYKNLFDVSHFEDDPIEISLIQIERKEKCGSFMKDFSSICTIYIVTYFIYQLRLNKQFFYLDP